MEHERPTMPEKLNNQTSSCSFLHTHYSSVKKSMFGRHIKNNKNKRVESDAGCRAQNNILNYTHTLLFLPRTVHTRGQCAQCDTCSQNISTHRPQHPKQAVNQQHDPALPISHSRAAELFSVTAVRLSWLWALLVCLCLCLSTSWLPDLPSFLLAASQGGNTALLTQPKNNLTVGVTEEFLDVDRRISQTVSNCW